MDWCLTKSLHEFRKLDWPFPTWPIYGVDKISVCQLNNVYTVQPFALLYFMSVKQPLRIEDTRRLLVFNHRCPESISRAFEFYWISSAEVKRMILDKDGKSIDGVVHYSHIRWLKHLFHINDHCLPQWVVWSGSKLKKIGVVKTRLGTTYKVIINGTEGC